MSKTGLNADTVCLYFHDSTLYSEASITAGIQEYVNLVGSKNKIQHIVCVVADKTKVIEFNTKQKKIAPRRRQPTSLSGTWAFSCKITTIFQTDKIFFIMPDVKSLWQRLLHDIQVVIPPLCQAYKTKKVCIFAFGNTRSAFAYISLKRSGVFLFLDSLKYWGCLICYKKTHHCLCIRERLANVFPQAWILS